MKKQQPQAATTPASLLVIGAHAGDAEISAGAIILKHTRAGARAAIAHLTLGEKGHPTLSPARYARQKKAEARKAAKALGAEVFFFPWKDGELPVSEQAKFAICDLIREVKPDLLITHWQGSFHKDHINTYHNVVDAHFYAAVKGFERELPAHGARGPYFVENWEDPFDFQPEIFVNTTDLLEAWEAAVCEYELFRGGVSKFPYVEYYRALARVRGAVVGVTHATALAIPPLGRRRRTEYLP